MTFCQSLPEPRTAPSLRTHLLIMRCLTLGDELVDPHFINSVADVMAIEGAKEQLTIDAEAVQLFYDGSSQFADSKVRRLLIDILRRYGKDFSKTCTDMPDELVSGLAKSFKAGAQKTIEESFEADPCYYHDHMGKDECFAKGAAGWEGYKVYDEK